MQRDATHVPQRELARRAGVSRAFVQELHALGLLGEALTEEDVLVAQCLACVPLRWRRSTGNGTGSLEPTPLLDVVAGLSRRAARSGVVDAVVIVTDSRAEVSTRAEACTFLETSSSPLLVLPVATWWDEIRSKAHTAVPP